MDIKGIWQADPLEPNKRKLLEAALIEFSTKGYERGSTNQIVHNAGVSKGMLFHFFGSKKGLFLAIVDACIEHFFAYIQARMEVAPHDFFERFLHVNQAKMALFAEEPAVYQMAVATFFDYPEECRTEIEDREAQFNARYIPLFLDQVDTTFIRAQFDHKKALHFMLSAVEALTQKYVRENYDASDKGFTHVKLFFTELETYLEMMRVGLYQPSDSDATRGKNDG
ncbi:TetR/AcrR family transcriptional regulator [Brevibacillus sp. 179-C9.3 HS]|uniref:TetR/AcrR family transcriptional regulator n=1 Tax=unclassified Brevibacillus TaxID=2684853 RepID=UPI0039A2A9E0